MVVGVPPREASDRLVIFQVSFCSMLELIGCLQAWTRPVSIFIYVKHAELFFCVKIGG